VLELRSCLSVAFQHVLTALTASTAPRSRMNNLSSAPCAYDATSLG
jgi:hypothetical protein